MKQELRNAATQIRRSALPSELACTIEKSLRAAGGDFSKCAVLGSPEHLNPGDHLIFLGSVMALVRACQAQITYSASVVTFSDRSLNKNAGCAPIVFVGGGNFGDLHPCDQLFRERVVRDYHDRPIIVLPQSMFFQSEENLERTSRIFNAHPKVTLFWRDQVSYNLAQQHFGACANYLMPDMSLYLNRISPPATANEDTGKVLFLLRNDRESNIRLAGLDFGPIAPVVQDWTTYDWFYNGLSGRRLKAPFDNLPCVTFLARELWQRSLADLPLMYSRFKWMCSTASPVSQSPLREQSSRSWSLVHDSLYQLSSSRIVVTDRLHAHIACILLGIPHILLANSYYKNQSFYDTWMKDIPWCRFAKDAAQVRSALNELLADKS